jgi:hypothetical protein
MGGQTGERRIDPVDIIAGCGIPLAEAIEQLRA